MLNRGWRWAVTRDWKPLEIENHSSVTTLDSLTNLVDLTLGPLSTWLTVQQFCGRLIASSFHETCCTRYQEENKDISKFAIDLHGVNHLFHVQYLVWIKISCCPSTSGNPASVPKAIILCTCCATGIPVEWWNRTEMSNPGRVGGVDAMPKLPRSLWATSPSNTMDSIGIANEKYHKIQFQSQMRKIIVWHKHVKSWSVPMLLWTWKMELCDIDRVLHAHICTSSMALWPHIKLDHL